jgi:hypothetical protein
MKIYESGFLVKENFNTEYSSNTDFYTRFLTYAATLHDASDYSKKNKSKKREN